MRLLLALWVGKTPYSIINIMVTFSVNNSKLYLGTLLQPATCSNCSSPQSNGMVFTNRSACHYSQVRSVMLFRNPGQYCGEPSRFMRGIR